MVNLDHHHLTTIEEENLAKLFDQLDINKDGRINVDDLQKGLHRLRVPQVPGQAQVGKRPSQLKFKRSY